MDTNEISLLASVDLRDKGGNDSELHVDGLLLVE
jgi:hypothetical protein